MKRFLMFVVAAAMVSGWLYAAAPILKAADSTVTAMPAASTLVGTELVYCVQGGADRKCTVDQVAVYTGTAIPPTAVPSDQTGTNYAFQSTDRAKVVYLSNAANQTPTIAAATGSFGNGWYTTACNTGVGTQTITPASGTIGGASTYVLPAGTVGAAKCAAIISDGTNYRVVPEFSTAAGGVTLIANGTSALGTSAITSATCATAVTTTATGTATTDTIQWGFNGDPTAVTGYVPLVAGMLTIIAYPSANNVNFKVCNNTSASVTPGAITLNWRVSR